MSDKTGGRIVKSTVGILGGSFNPPHVGHLALARTVLDSGLTDRVCLIPAAIPPHKAAPWQADAATRLAMTRLLAEADPRLLVDDIELGRAGVSFTIDTVSRLMELHPETSYRLIIGSDLAKTFASWRCYRDLLRLAPPLVAERPDSPFADDEEYSGMSAGEADVMRRGRFAMRPMDVSSTRVREMLAAGAPDEALLAYLTGPVLRFIREHNLYGAG